MPKEYINEIPFDDSNFIDYFKNIIKEVVRDEMKKLKFNRKVVAKVVSVGVGVANIQLLDSSNTISNVKVRDGLTLDIDDYVYVEAINGSLNNIFIDIKK